MPLPFSPVVIRILHLEDSLPHHWLICERLRAEQLECEVTRVSTEAEFRAVLVSGCPDLILAEYCLANFDGGAALRIVLRHCPEVPFIVVSGAIGETEAVEILKAGATDYILKDRYERLAPAIRRALAETESRRARHEAERASRENAALLADFFDNATIGLHWCGPDGTILRANQAELTLLGYTAEEYVGRPVAGFHVDREVIEDIFSRLNRGEVVHEREARLRCKDGSIKQVAIASSVMRDAEGRFVHSRCFTRDITKKKQAEAEARASAEQLRLIADTAPVLIAHWDREYRYRFVNEPYAARFGLRREQVVGRRIAEVMGETAYASFRPHVERALAGEAGEFEVALTLESLGTHWMRCAYAPERAANGEVVGLVAVLNDITERKRMEGELRRSEALYRAIGESIDYGVWVCAPDGRNTYVSESFLTLLGITQEQCSDFGWGNRLSPEESARTIAAWQECVRVGGKWDREHRFLGADGAWHSILARGVPVRDERGAIVSWAGINLDITERKYAEDALRQSEQRLRLMAETMSQGVVHHAADGRIIAMNRAAERILGKSRDQFLGSTSEREAHDTIREDGSPFPGAEHPSIVALQTGEQLRGIVMGVFNPQRKEYRWIRIEAVPIFLAGETRPSEVYAIFEDITEQKRAEQSLREAHDRLQAVMSSITDGLAMLDRNWCYTYFSEQAARIIGMRPEQLLGRRIWDVFPEAEKNKFGQAYRRAVATGRPEEVEEYYPAPLNKWLECRCYPSAEGLSIYFHDITARKQAEAVLRQNEALFSALIEQAPGGVYVIDDQFRLIEINALARPVFATCEPVIGRDFGEIMRLLWGVEKGPELAAIFRHTLETGERYMSPRFTHERADLGVVQSYDWEVQRLILPNGRHGAVCYFTDVTVRLRNEEALRAAKETAEAANASKDRFLAALSHELRTPLTPVLMTASALEHDPDLRPDVREDIAMIKRNIELETKLIDDLLDVSRIASGKIALRLEPLDLNEAVRQACAICRPQLREQGVKLELALAADAFTVTADAARLQQVLWNVLKNAVKFTPADGTVRVATTRLGAERCEVRVSDTGIGIMPELLPKVFDAFEQGDSSVTRQFGGLGLGLAISKALVDLHGGVIRAESAGLGQGATFVIDLPASVIAVLPTEPERGVPEDEGPQRAALRLLVVEDHANTASTLRLLLTKAGYEVQLASSVASALELAGRERFDLLITDIGLPDGTGYDVITGLKPIQPLPGVVMSGYGMEKDLQRSREAGFTEHVLKPFDVPELLAAIGRASAAER